MYHNLYCHYDAFAEPGSMAAAWLLYHLTEVLRFDPLAPSSTTFIGHAGETTAFNLTISNR